MQHKVLDAKDVVIRFAGDSGDGMQLTGSLFADMSAFYGNTIATFPDYPAEIRAPHGTVSGVSGFQVHIGSEDVNTPGDFCDLLVAMNPAALKANAKWCKRNAMILVDEDSFDEAGMKKAGFTTDNPFLELGVEDRTLIVSPITTMTLESLKESGMDKKSMLKCKNMFTLGMACYIYDRPLEYIYQYLEKKFSKKHPEVIEPNKKVLNDGFNYAANIQAIADTYHVAPAKKLKKGTYRNISGNQALAWGLLAASEKSGLPLFCGSYPITPATGILEELAIHKSLGCKTLQAEDEIAGICTAIGASFAGNLAVTTTSGPGLSLKSEALGLAVMAELPLVVVDVQRGGPSTGLPTKTEQSDLNQALYGRNGECPVCVIAAHSPSHCFDAAFQAAKIALEHMTPVLLLSEGFLGNGSEPWRIPKMADYPEIHPPFINGVLGPGEKFKPFERDPETLVRRWAVPGQKGFEHRVGGLEKNHSGVLSTDPVNHETMVRERAEKVERINAVIPPLEVEGAQSGKLLVVGWGGTYGHILSAVHEVEGSSFAHFDYICPLPANTGEVFSRFEKLLVCELNSGQFADYLLAKFPGKEIIKFNKIQGQPFLVSELVDAIKKES
ncbi:MAG: 2-oxoacid:acceptor oxidoreductase subunit alpha [Bacteroidales bacterium]|nr:2-oxoacid:acceptor oxidoreductase subunit alpha [Candidatus Cryptobacteroides equifaecalis]